MTCQSCRHSIGRAADLTLPAMLWCTRHRTAAVRVCAEFQYEPGAAG